MKDAKIPTISLDLGVHIHNIVSFLSKEKPLRVSAIQNTFGKFDQVIDNINGIVEYTNSLICNFWYTKAALGERNGLKIRVFAEKGSAQWYQMEPETLSYTDEYGKKINLDRSTNDVQVSSLDHYNRFKAGHPSGFIEAFANYYYDIADLLIEYKKTNKRQNSEFVFDIDNAIEGLIVLESIVDSSNDQCWQAIKLEKK